MRAPVASDDPPNFITIVIRYLLIHPMRRHHMAAPMPAAGVLEMLSTH